MRPKTFIKPGTVRVRLAPSPTGPLHVGTARTALFNYLFAKRYGGSFILRIEDTDLERSEKKYEQDIVEGLRWLRILWDEGADVGGEYAPYRQTERIHVYSRYLNQLLEEKNIYHCFCSEEDLAAQRQDQLARGEPPRYSGKCRELSAEEVRNNLNKGKNSILRFKVPGGRKIAFDDLIRGRITFNSDEFDDFAIAKSVSIPLYNFAVVIDDHEMKITHVIRGEDHISNTPKQIMLQEVLNFPSPKYGHLPLILGEDRSKLSKRNATVSISQYRDQGYLPEAMVNFMALLGWNPKTEREMFTLTELADAFDLEEVQKSGAVFNIDKLNWINGCYIRQTALKDLTAMCVPYLEKLGLIKKISGSGDQSSFEIIETGEKIDAEKLSMIVAMEQQRLKTLSETGERTGFFFRSELAYDPDLLKWKNASVEEIRLSLDKIYEILSNIETLDFTAENLRTILMIEAGKGDDRGKLLWPMRVSLCGLKDSPGPFEIAAVLGKEKSLKRVKEAMAKLRP